MVSPEAALWDRVGAYVLWADAFGWTPEQVDKLPHWFAERGMDAYRILLQVRKEKHEAEAKQQ